VMQNLLKTQPKNFVLTELKSLWKAGTGALKSGGGVWRITLKSKTSFVSVYFVAVTPQSVQRWATGCKIGVLGFDSQRGMGTFPYLTASRTAQRPTQPPIQWISGALSLGIKWPGRESDHSSPSSAAVKNAWRYTSTPPISLHGVVLSSAQGQLYF
jgi:hypothetical protein